MVSHFFSAVIPPEYCPVDFLDSVPSDLENLLAAHPTGEARAFWNKEPLSRKDQELRQSEERYKATIESGCRELLRHFRGT